MSKNLEALEKLQIPDDQIGRQAVDCLRGYVYQIYQSLASWIGIKEDETLLLEVAEDFAVVAEGVLAATQVKDTGRSVTLRTQAVSAAIKALWDFQEANPGKTVYLNYLTTAKVGREKKLKFPDGHTGLTYWRVAAREGSDVEPMRKALLALKLPSKICGFITGATPEQLREKVLRRIQWICGTEDIEVLNKTILDLLINRGDRFHFTASDCERVRNALVAEILRVIVRKNGRSLNKTDFLQAFEKASSVSMPLPVVRKCMEVMAGMAGESSGGLVFGAGVVIEVSEIPLPPRTIERRELVSELITAMGRTGTMWIYGSSGVGKTVVAQLVARRSERQWVLVQLRDCSGADLEYRLRRVLEVVNSRDIGGVILDDFPTKHAHGSLVRLSMLASEMRRMDGSVLITTSKAPFPNLQDLLGVEGLSVKHALYFSQSEVGELVEAGGGDPEKWAGVIYTFCGFGHPQLVQARITGLKQKNWPKSELLAGFGPLGGPAEEIDSMRDAIRERLISELPANTRELLYRLTLLIGYFDRELAIAVGEVDPAIERPGEELDILLGPWVESMASNRFRISPLVGDAGRQTLGKAIQVQVHKRIVDDLIQRRPFPADFLGMLLSHALVAQDARGVTWITMAILNAREEDRVMISEHLLILALLDTRQALFKDDIRVSSMLRFCQFHVAAWANRTDQLPEIADRLISEARMIDDKEIADGFLYHAIISILGEKSLKISPRKWMPLIRELEHLLNGQGALIEYVRELDAVKKGLNGFTLRQFLFAIRATSVTSTDELIELFMELDGLEEDQRHMLLSSLDQIPSGNRLMIDSAWLGEHLVGKIDGVALAEKYRQLGETAEGWGENDIAVECECARAVMLDEYADDSEGALAALAEAEKRHPNHVRLVRQRASVYYRRGDHPTALATIAQIADLIPKEEHVDRAFALREAGISATKTGDYAKASRFFSQAYEAAAAGTGDLWPMAIGLKGDWAVAEFELGNRNEALNLMYQALIDAEQIDPDAGKKEKYCRRVLGAVIVWMQKQVCDEAVPVPGVAIFPGCCSYPNPPEEFLKLESGPFLFCWYHLASLEALLKADCGILDELRKRTGTERILFGELLLNHYIMAKHISLLDTDGFFLYLPEYVVKGTRSREQVHKGEVGNIFELTVEDFRRLRADDWKNEVHLAVAKEAVLALMVRAACSGMANFQECLRNSSNRDEQLSAALGPLLEAFEGRPSSKQDSYEVVAYYVGRLMRDGIFLTPDEMFMVSFRLWEWLRSSNFRILLQDEVAGDLAEGWQEIITNRRFTMRQPMVSVPAIEAALKGPRKGVGKIAEIILAAENGVRHTLNADLRAEMKK
jgi:tetratricopeptide (TPR) repeat protein